MPETDKTEGVYEKYRVERTDGRSEPGEKHHGCRYFVLDLDHDPHAAAALRAYAESCQEDYPELASDTAYAAEQIDNALERLPGEGVDLGFKKGHIWGGGGIFG